MVFRLVRRFVIVALMKTTFCNKLDLIDWLSSKKTGWEFNDNDRLKLIVCG